MKQLRLIHQPSRSSQREWASSLLIAVIGLAASLTLPVKVNALESTARTIDLGNASSALMTIYGADAEDTHFRIALLNRDLYFQAVAKGDVNGDGIADIIIGAPYAKGPGNSRPASTGEVYVYFGRDDGSFRGVRDAAAQDAGPDVIIYGSSVTSQGTNVGSVLGVALASADLNGDGIDDMILGASSYTPVPNQLAYGGAVVYMGGRDLVSGTRYDLAGQAGPPPQVVYGGIGIGSAAGGVLATGDVNNDGVADLVIGAPAWNRGTSTTTFGTGAALLFPGTRSLSGAFSMAIRSGMPGGPAAAFAGEQPTDAFGAAIAVGDVNGDGAADILVGANGAKGPGGSRPGAGEAYLFFGGASLPPGSERDTRIAGTADVLFLGGVRDDSFGQAALMYDFDADGTKDLLIGATHDSGEESLPYGAVHVFLGGPGLKKGTIRDVYTGPPPEGTGSDARIIGPAPGAGFPSPAMVTAELNGDGRLDLIVAAPGVSKPGADRAGAAYVIYGKNSFKRGTVLDLREAQGEASADVIILGARAQDFMPFGVDAGDVNQDQKVELFLTCPGCDGPNGSRPNSGTVYVVNIPST